MNKRIDWVVIGRFGRTHGIKGFITVHSFTEPRENILHYTDWHVNLANHWQALKLLHLEVNNKSIIAQIEGYREREQAACLTNAEIAISSTQLPVLQPGEYYWHELVGMQVMNQKDQLLGKVLEILPTGANDVLVIAEEITSEKRHLIPYVPGHFIIDVDRSNGLIKVDWDMDFATK